MLLRSFAVLVLFCSQVFAAIDGDCSSNAGVSSDCKSVIAYTDGEPFNENRDYSIKLKRLFDIDLGDWGGNEITDGDTEAALDGRRFCLIAYHERRNQVDRRMEDLLVDFSGPLEEGRFVLEPVGDNGYPGIPVTLTIKGTSNSAHSALNADLLTAPPIELTAVAGKQICRNNELIITASIEREDIFAFANSGSYKSSFTLSAQRAHPNDLIPAEHKSVSISFNVTVSVVSLVQISGLEDMKLEAHSGQPVENSQSFCVFTFGANSFGIQGSSVNGSNQFLLESAGNTIPYQVAINRVAGGQDSEKVLVEGADFVSDSSWEGVNSALCQSGQENMLIRISVSAADMSSKPAGSYQDTLELTVTPN